MAAQSWKVINVASRDTFDWKIIRRSEEFTEGEKLKNFILLWSKTLIDCYHIVYPDWNFSDAVIYILFYGDDWDLGKGKVSWSAYGGKKRGDVLS